jgi:hypothetical protein
MTTGPDVVAMSRRFTVKAQMRSVLRGWSGKIIMGFGVMPGQLGRGRDGSTLLTHLVAPRAKEAA